MGINKTENIVKKELIDRGYDVIRNNNVGYPDFKVYHKDKKEFFYLEVKTEPIVYSFSQKSIFKVIQDKIVIALVKDKIIEFTNYKTKEKLFDIEIKSRVKAKPNTKCLNCNYEWYTTSEKIYVNCPSCRTAVKINKINKK